jgi:hypothetical protein
MRLVRLLSAACLPALLLSAPLAAQQVYKWKDAQGVTHFTAEPPPKGAAFEAREVDHHQAVAPPADAGDDAPAPKARSGEDPACATARGNLALLDGDRQVTVDSDGDGKPDKPLSDADRARQRNLARAILDAKCRGAAAAQPPEPEER